MDMNFTPNLVVGVVLTLAGVVLTLDRLGIMAAWNLFQYWPVLLVLFGLSVVVQALRGGVNGNGNGHSHRQRPIITPGLVFLMIIGWILVSNASQRSFNRVSESTDDRVTLVAVMGQDTRTSRATNFQRADMTAFMGSSRLDLRQARIAPGEEAVVEVFGMMGEVQVLVPEGWMVDVRTVPIMGGVRDQRFGAAFERTRGDRRLPPITPLPEAPPAGATPESPAPQAPDTTAASGPPAKLVIRGFVMMGALVVRS
jgi:hypothetical protein